MKKKVYLTNHSKQRFSERTDYNQTAQAQNATKAFKVGYEFSEFKDPMSSFLKSISFDGGKYVAKVYNNYVYIFNNCNGHRLLTVYAVPEEFLPIEQHLIPKEDLGRCMIALTDKNGKRYYWHEFGGLTTDIYEALEFTNQIKATNYVNNNRELDSYKDAYEIELF